MGQTRLNLFNQVAYNIGKLKLNVPQVIVDPCPDYPDLESVRSLLCQVVDEAQLLEAARDARTKEDGSIVTAVDFQIQESIKQQLHKRWPDYAFVGEEMEFADQVRLLRGGRQGIWCLDPLDGTTNFAAGFPFFGVSLAFIVDGNSKLGVVYDPVRGECFYARQGQGAWLNGEPLQTANNVVLKQCIANVDYKRLVGRLTDRLIQSPPYRSQRNLGASVLEWCWLAAGRFHLYLHGGQKLWDYAAGQLILAEAGGCAMSIDGDAIQCDNMVKQSVVAASNMNLLQEWFRWVQENISHVKRQR